ncbi:MAG: ABC transporter substrate-binding protein [Alphaproteobacteria bacterium]|nr:ABC transporter substrate-binding protein [Alphaproteobacteria bacterium]
MYDLDRMKGMAAKGKVSRRDFVQFALALGLSVTAAETMFVKAARSEPKRGGFLRIGGAHGSTTDTLDPSNYLDTYSQSVFGGYMSNSLTFINHKGEWEPDLAESLEPSDDAAQWVVRLRKGVTFHDGKDFTSEDVIATTNFIRGEESKSPVKSTLESVVEVKADGPHTVIFKMSAGNADFPYVLSDLLYCMLPSRDGVADWQSGVRTGAFILENFEPGVTCKQKRNPNYHWEGRPYFDEVESLVLTDVVARTNALTTGDIHYMNRCDLKTLNLLERTQGVVVSELTGFGHLTLPMLTTVAPFDDVNVRRALKHAINRQDIVDKIFFGHATPGNDNPIPPPPSVKYATVPEPIHVYDPDKAKFYLKEAGLSSLKVDLSMADAAFAGAVDTGVLIREHAAACGIDVNVVREPNDGYWDNVWLKKPWSASYWSGRPTVDWMFTQAYLGGVAWNETRWTNARFDELVNGARAELDDAKRGTMYAEAQQILHDDGGQVVLVFRNFVDAHSDTLAHNEVAVNWEIDGLKLAERWWFA